ncbi:MAG: cadmium-translocating P-type ATPase [Nitrospinota bacterium]|nr:MAG: cadmium-translocating P-type ATPase [Nitrospinota bacterium]
MEKEEKILQLEIPVLLPAIADNRDQCVERLTERIANYYKGITRVHVDRKDGEALLCLHYDPNLVSLEWVRRVAEEAGAEVTRRYQHETLPVTGMDCPDCAGSLEHLLGRMDGIIDVAVNYAAEKMRVEYDTTLITHEEIVRRVQSMGYEIVEERQQRWVQEHRELVLSLLSGGFLAGGFLGEWLFGLPRTAAVVLYLLAYLTGGYDATRHGITAARHLRFDIDFLMVVAALGAAIVGEWAEGALLLFLFSLGHALEHYAMGRARRAIQALGELTPKTARVRRDGQEQELPVTELQRGDVVIVRPGERIPIDGTVVEGRSAVDESPITGESLPVEKTIDDPVFAGTLNGDGSLEIVVTKLARDTTLARIVQMVEEAQTQKSPTQRFTERFERIFVPVVLGGVLAVAVSPPLIGWLPWSEAFLRAMTILVAASPCALAIAIPSTVLAGIAQAARNGVLIKGGVYLENLGRLKAMAFDKTGTITRGQPEVTDIIPAHENGERELLSLAATVESRSTHPLAQAVVRKAQEQGIALSEAVGELYSFTGRGVQAELNGQVVRVGNITLFTEQQEAIPEHMTSTVHRLEAEGKTTMLVQMDQRFYGVIAVADQPRPEARATLAQLRTLGIPNLIMLTGDNERVAAAIAHAVGLTTYRANLLPQEKVAAIKTLLDTYGEVAMVGDGVNDAPALTQATVGIAMGARGTDVALETADVALMADDLSKLPFAVALSRQARHIIWQNLFLSLGVIAALVPTALLGMAGIGVAIAFHEGSTLLVVANALRLLRFHGKKPS